MELCRKDSDGDGRTNGEELGDPNCVWRENAIPDKNAFSHPGIDFIILKFYDFIKRVLCD